MEKTICCCSSFSMGPFVIVFSFSGYVFVCFPLFFLRFFVFPWFFILWQRLCLGDQGEHVIHYSHGTVCHRFVNVSGRVLHVFLDRNQSLWSALLAPVLGIVGHPPMGPARQDLNSDMNAIGPHARFFFF